MDVTGGGGGKGLVSTGSKQRQITCYSQTSKVFPLKFLQNSSKFLNPFIHDFPPFFCFVLSFVLFWLL